MKTSGWIITGIVSLAAVGGLTYVFTREKTKTSSLQIGVPPGYSGWGKGYDDLVYF